MWDFLEDAQWLLYCITLYSTSALPSFIYLVLFCVWSCLKCECMYSVLLFIFWWEECIKATIFFFLNKHVSLIVFTWMAFIHFKCINYPVLKPLLLLKCCFLTWLVDEWKKKGEVKASFMFILVDLSQASFAVWLNDLNDKWKKCWAKVLLMFIWLRQAFR